MQEYNFECKVFEVDYKVNTTHHEITEPMYYAYYGMTKEKMIPTKQSSDILANQSLYNITFNNSMSAVNQLRIQFDGLLELVDI